MWLEEHPLLAIYLLGGCVVLMLALFKMALFASINWAIRHDVLNKNIKKILPPEERPFRTRLLMASGVLAFEMLLSWINVAVILWQMGIQLLGLFRDQLQPAPEAIKELRFPLRNNPDMSRETVWAYTTALAARAGHGEPTVDGLLQSLQAVAECYTDFSPSSAIYQLEGLRAVRDETTAAAKLEVQKQTAVT
jgi:hypothetical protein